MSQKHVLAIDPSGSHMEGRGTSGWVILDSDGNIEDRGYIAAVNFSKPEEYWQAHNILIAATYDKYGHGLSVVIEDFLLYANKAMDQINSRMETCRLIGVMQVFCYEAEIPYILQRAVDVKKRWSNEILEAEKIIESHVTHFVLTSTGERINRHELDALRHAYHFINFKQKPVWEKPAAPRLSKFYNFQDRPWEGRKE